MTTDHAAASTSAPDIKRNVLVLASAQALGASGAPIIISLGGLVGLLIAPTPALATLPVSLYTIGVATGTLPVAWFVSRFGRRETYLAGAAIGALGGVAATLGVLMGWFALFCVGCFMAGLYGTGVQSYRFAATESVAPAMRPRAISAVMIGGLVAAIIGPQAVVWSQALMPGLLYAGSFMVQAVMPLLAVPVLLMLRNPPPRVKPARGSQRPLREIITQPKFMLAAGTGVVTYSLMSFMMTAAPIAMINCGLTVADAALGIQWHVLAMFGPSFFTGRLIQRFGTRRMAIVGLLLIAMAAISGLSGLSVGHFWIALILLGLGWNFAFVASTTMVTEVAGPEEAPRVQGANDFIVFGVVALSSLMSGAIISAAGWTAVTLCLLAIAAATAGLLALESRRHSAGMVPTGRA